MQLRKLYPMQLLCEAVAQQLDGSLPLGEAWHRDLIEQMTLDLGCGVGSLLRYLSETRCIDVRIATALYLQGA